MTHFHGPVPLNDSAYATRPFERDLVREIQTGRWVLFLGPRQHGKTSALLRLQKTLVDHGMMVVLIDLQRVPPVNTYSGLITWFGTVVARALGTRDRVDETDDLATALAQALPTGNSPIILLIDEASNISNDEWRNAFFGQLRAISSDRAVSRPDEIASRLRFVFSGTFRPERLVSDANSPFNVCERIDTTDLVLDDLRELAAKAGIDPVAEIASMVFDRVGGQPFLAQKLFDAANDAGDQVSAVQAAIDELREGHSDHVSNLFRRVLSEPALAEIVRRVTCSGPVRVEAGDQDQKYLITLGVLKRQNGTLVFRNQLYAEIAASSPQLTGVIKQEAPKAVLFAIEANSFAKVASPELREIAYTAQLGAIASYRGGSNRLALAGLGTTLEAVLLDYLQRQTPGKLAKASQECKQRGGHFNAGDPSTWALVDLMRGARKLINKGELDIPETLRHWRNLIHPAVSLKDYKPDETLGPEVSAASGLLSIVLRDLP